MLSQPLTPSVTFCVALGLAMGVGLTGRLTSALQSSLSTRTGWGWGLNGRGLCCRSPRSMIVSPAVMGHPRPGITTVWGWLKRDARRLMLVYTPQQARSRIARSVAAGAGSPASYANIAACGVPPEFDYASYVIALCCQYATPRLCLHLREAGARCRGWNPNMVADGGLFTTTSPTHVPEPASFVAHTMDYARGLLAGGELGGVVGRIAH